MALSDIFKNKKRVVVKYASSSPYADTGTYVPTVCLESDDSDNEVVQCPTANGYAKIFKKKAGEKLNMMRKRAVIKKVRKVTVTPEENRQFTVEGITAKEFDQEECQFTVETIPAKEFDQETYVQPCVPCGREPHATRRT